MLGNKKEKEVAKKDKKNWYNDRYQFVVVQRNFFAIVTVLSLACSIAATFSISQLAPLKSVEPFVIQVDQKTGITQVVDPLKSSEITGNESINQYFIVQYCRARESFLGSQERNNYNYNVVRVLSEPEIFSSYYRDVAVSNTDSPIARLGANGLREVKIGSIKLLDRKTLPTGEEVMRYLVVAQITEKGLSSSVKTMQKIISIEFKYAELELTTEDRYLNPIGFRVLGYHVDDNNLTQ